MLKIFSAKNTQEVKAAQTGLIGESAKLLRNELKISNELPVDLVRITNEIKKAIVSYQKENSKDISSEGIIPHIYSPSKINIIKYE